MCIQPHCVPGTVLGAFLIFFLAALMDVEIPGSGTTAVTVPGP